MGYTEIDPSEWKPVNDGDCIEGVFLREQKDVGVNKSMLYVLETPEGAKNIWGSTILDSKMALIKSGEKVKITFKGFAEAKSGKNPAKIFKVEVDRE